MVYFKKFMLIILLCIMINIFGSSFIEYRQLQSKQAEIRTFAALSYGFSTAALQSANATGLSATTLNPAALTQYCRELRQQAISKGIVSDYFSEILNVMQGSAGSLAFMPLQFGLTYIDKEQFTQAFKSVLKSYVNYNYGPEGLIGQNTVIMSDDDIEVRIEGPTLLQLDSNLKSYIFGTHSAVTSVKDNNDKSFDYAVAYAIQIKVKFASVTTTPFFSTKDGQVVIGTDKTPPIYYARRFMLLN
ncbi:MAG: hypothetical protein RSC43_01025 [Clostridia bacterium]